MKQTVYEYDFRQAFEAAGRAGNFSYEGLGVLFDYLEEVDEDYELDVIGLCCEYAEATLDEINSDYNQDFDDIEEAQDWLNERTAVCGMAENDDGEETIVFAQF